MPYYPDVQSSHVHFQWIQKAREQGFITTEQVPTCQTPGNFCPDAALGGTATRGQMTYYMIRGVLGDHSF
jgi:hypothetical protein